ncbi:MAG: diguanylate cyclase [Alphaproteobacteria bacterium]|nr:diguanylate cyclase [Alphaproteobacteria bacterium]
MIETAVKKQVPRRPFAEVTVALAVIVLAGELILPAWAEIAVAVAALLFAGLKAPSGHYVALLAAVVTAVIGAWDLWAYAQGHEDAHELIQAATSIGLIWALTYLCLRHQATLGRASETQGRMMEAMESISEGFVLFDADDRLVICNRRVHDMYPKIRDLLVPGTANAAILRAGAERGQFKLGGLSVEEWLAARLAKRTETDSVFEQELGDGRWVRISERPTADGGYAGIRTDITEEKRREETLRRTGQRFRSISANVPTVIFQRLMTPDGHISYPYVSAGVREIYGFDPAEIMAKGNWIDTAVTPEEQEAYVAAIRRSAETLETWSYEGKVRTGTGEPRWVRAVARPTRQDSGDVIWDGVCLDVTEFKRTEEELRNRVVDLQESQERLEAQGAELGAMAISLSTARDQAETATRRAEASEQRYRMLAEHSPVGIWHIGTDGTTRYMNPAMLSLVGVTSVDEVTGRDFRSIVQVDSITLVERTIARARSLGTASCNFALHTTGTDVRQLVFSAGVLHGADGRDEGVLASVIDMTEQRRMEEAMLHMAQHDSLTGLPNRALFNDRVQQALAQAGRTGQQVAALLLDLDRFKHVNDMLGHVVGDQLLQAVAERLRLCTRRSDSVARLGGDEFAIIASNLDSSEMIEVLARRVIESLSQPFLLDGNEVHSGASIGITLYPADTRDANELLRFADMALYRAKDVGRGTYAYYDQSMNDGARARKELEIELRRAIQENQFELHYQPTMDVATTRITGFEALIRWHHPEKGLVPPNLFIPVAESSGLILPIGR